MSRRGRTFPLSDERAVEQGIRDALGHVSNAIQFLAGGSADGEMFAEDTLPRRSDHPERSRYLIAEHVDAAIDYLTVIRQALEHNGRTCMSCGQPIPVVST